MKKYIYIIDASVIMAVFLEKDKIALDIFSKIVTEAKKKKVALWAPSFALFEVANTLRYSKEDKWLVFDIWDLIRKAPINYFNYNDLHISFFPSIALLSRKLGTAFYNTYYHYLAITSDGTFLTRDKKYFEKAEHLGNIKCF